MDKEKVIEVFCKKLGITADQLRIEDNPYNQEELIDCIFLVSYTMGSIDVTYENWTVEDQIMMFVLYNKDDEDVQVFFDESLEDMLNFAKLVHCTLG